MKTTVKEKSATIKPESVGFKSGRLAIIDRQGKFAYLEFTDIAGDNTRKRFMNVSNADAAALGVTPVSAAATLFKCIVDGDLDKDAAHTLKKSVLDAVGKGSTIQEAVKAAAKGL